MIKLKDGYYLDLETLDVVSVEDGVVIGREPMTFPSTSFTSEETFSEYGHYGENNPPLPFTPVGDKEYEV